MKNLLLSSIALITASQIAASELTSSINADLPELEKLYLHLHQNPELSYQEKETGKTIAQSLTKLGFSVIDNVGGFGVVGLYKNGNGPTIMIRTDTDGLPITEKTGKSYASKITTRDKNNNTVGVMHGCGHDIHMTSFIGTAQQLIKNKSNWQGTLMMVAQPAEEVGAGAKAMLKEGLYSKYAKPDHILGLHVSASVPVGKITIAPGYALANVDSVDITVKGKSGHGAYPHLTIDPIVLASRIVLALQTINSREISPLKPSVITVGSIHGGSKHNIISNEVKLQLTLRSYDPAVREQQINAIKRLTKGIAISAGLNESNYPAVYVHEEEKIPSTYNNPILTKQITSSITKELGLQNVLKAEPVMAGEDFGLYTKTDENIPSTIFWLGGVSVKDYELSIKNNTSLPSLHSSKFAPDYPIAITTGVRAMTASAMDLFNQ